MNTDILHAYMDGELAPEEAAAVEKALASDPNLAAELRLLGRVDDALGTLPGCEAPEDLAERVLTAAKRRRGLLLRVCLPLAAAAAAALVALLPLRPGARPEGDVFTLDEHMGYVWEADADTYGSLALDDLEERILQELEAT